MYKNASRLAQRKAERILPQDIPEFNIKNVSLTEIRENLVTKHQKLVKELSTDISDPILRSKLKKDFARVTNQLEALKSYGIDKAHGRGNAEVHRHFVSICKEQMTKAQFDSILTEAFKRFRNPDTAENFRWLWDKKQVRKKIEKMDPSNSFWGKLLKD